MGSAGVGRTFQLLQRQARLAVFDWTAFSELERLGLHPPTEQQRHIS
jgi:hypothetical protein